MICQVVDRVLESRAADRVLVATDDERIAAVVLGTGAEAIMTSPDHRTGTERVAEVASRIDAEVIINVQGDEPLIEGGTIRAALDPMLRDASLQMSSASAPVESIEEVLSPNVVKVVTDSNGFALYFSRQPIPWPRDPVARSGGLRRALEMEPGLLALFRKHTGLYVYRRSTLLRLSRSEPTPLEHAESLEQLRAVEYGIPILVVPLPAQAIGVDTMGDLERVRTIFAQRRHDG